MALPKGDSGGFILPSPAEYPSASPQLPQKEKNTIKIKQNMFVLRTHIPNKSPSLAYCYPKTCGNSEATLEGFTFQRTGMDKVECV